MMTNLKLFILLAVFLTSLQICLSQENNNNENISGSIQERALKYTLNNWQSTGNPTSLGVNPIPNYGITYFGGVYLSGDITVTTEV